MALGADSNFSMGSLLGIGLGNKLSDWVGQIWVVRGGLVMLVYHDDLVFLIER